MSPREERIACALEEGLSPTQVEAMVIDGIRGPQRIRERLREVGGRADVRVAERRVDVTGEETIDLGAVGSSGSDQRAAPSLRRAPRRATPSQMQVVAQHVGVATGGRFEPRATRLKAALGGQ